MLDCLDPDALVPFWQEALGYQLADSLDGYRVLVPREGEPPGPVLILMPDTKATPSRAEIAELVDLRLFMTTRYAELYLPAGTPLLDHADSAMLLAALPRREPPP